MSINSLLKRNAKLALRENWGKAIGIFSVILAVQLLLNLLRNVAVRLFITDVFSPNPTMELLPVTQEQILREMLISGIFVLVTLLLVAPLSLGMLRWHYRLVHGKKPAFSEMFYYFESLRRYLRALWLEIMLTLRYFFWAVLFFLAPSALLGFSLYLIGNNAGNGTVFAAATVGIIFSCLLMLLLMVLYLMFTMRYFLAAYLVAGDDELGVWKAVKESVRYTKGYRVSLFVFYLSFFGWFLLGLFFFPLLYVVPYLNTSCAMYARFVIEKNTQHAPVADTTQEFRVEQAQPTYQQPEALEQALNDITEENPENMPVEREED